MRFYFFVSCLIIFFCSCKDNVVTSIDKSLNSLDCVPSLEFKNSPDIYSKYLKYLCWEDTLDDCDFATLSKLADSFEIWFPRLNEYRLYELYSSQLQFDIVHRQNLNSRFEIDIYKGLDDLSFDKSVLSTIDSVKWSVELKQVHGFPEQNLIVQAVIIRNLKRPVDQRIDIPNYLSKSTYNRNLVDQEYYNKKLDKNYFDQVINNVEDRWKAANLLNRSNENFVYRSIQFLDQIEQIDSSNSNQVLILLHHLSSKINFQDQPAKTELLNFLEKYKHNSDIPFKIRSQFANLKGLLTSDTYYDYLNEYGIELEFKGVNN